MDKYRILIAEDEKINRDLLQEFLESDDMEIDFAEDGKTALEKIIQNKLHYVAILLDIHMPKIDGIEMLKIMYQEHMTDTLPVIVISGETSAKIKKECYDLGIIDYIERPYDPYMLSKKVEKVIQMNIRQRYLTKKIREQNVKLEKQYRLIYKQNEQLKNINSTIIDAMGTIIEYRHMESGEHIHRVKKFTRCLAEYVMREYPQYGLDREKVDMIVSVSPLHDLGKIAIPDNILQKPGKLTKDEFDYMKSHTVRGCFILEDISASWTTELKQYCYEICRHHHERYDGKGYPDGLVGEEIPIAAQIVSVADVYDALANDRVYKSAYSKEETYQMIIHGECGVFSPNLMESFSHVKEAFEQIIDESKANVQI